jgi:hypothetical protein
MEDKVPPEADGSSLQHATGQVQCFFGMQLKQSHYPLLRVSIGEDCD